MATPESLAIRRSAALERVNATAEVIAEATGAVLAPFPDPHKRPELRPVEEAEWLAETLDAIAERAGPLSDGAALESQIAGLNGSIVALAKERDDAQSEVELHKDHVSKEQTTLDAVQHLMTIAASDDYVRLALVKSGWLQAKQDADGGDWSVSVIGVGPDLFAEPATSSVEPEPTSEPTKQPETSDAATKSTKSAKGKDA